MATCYMEVSNEENDFTTADITQAIEMESDDLLLSDLRRQSTPSYPKEDSTRQYSKLASAGKRYWKAPCTMIALFLLAWGFAASHLALFIVLNDRRADGPNSISQSDVATLSHLLGLLFRTCLCGSLSIAFTQYLWVSMRVKTLKASSIELLLNICHNPSLSGLSELPEVLRYTPLLVTLALFISLLPIAITFPPGALIVVSKANTKSTNVSVPTYNASFLGNGSVADQRLHSLAVWLYYMGGVTYGESIPLVQRIGRLVLETGDIVPKSSPCGPDCTYMIQFEGPYLQCSTTIVNKTDMLQLGHLEQDSMCTFHVFSAAVYYDHLAYTDVTTYYHINMTNISVSQHINYNEAASTLSREMKGISCKPSRVLYTTRFTYIDGVRIITYAADYINSLNEFLKHAPFEHMPNPPLCSSENGLLGYPKPGCTLQDSAPWNKSQIDVVTAFNHYALTNALSIPLTGYYMMTGTGDFKWGNENGDSASAICGPEGTIVADTRLNTQRDSPSSTPNPIFNITQDSLNDALFNITISTAIQTGFWNDNVAANITDHYNAYSFSAPSKLIVPYVSCLLLSVPFLILGLNSLRLNGVSAMQGGFFQILMTTTGSKSLHEAAAGGCIGGAENVPDELKHIKIRFGELRGSGKEGGVMRAGFGTDDEIAPLKRGVSYGL